jgi:hypothetical protein
MLRLGWARLKMKDQEQVADTDQVETTELGLAVLSALEEGSADQALETTLVLDEDDPVAKAKLIGEILFLSPSRSSRLPESAVWSRRPASSCPRGFESCWLRPRCIAAACRPQDPKPESAAREFPLGSPTHNRSGDRRSDVRAFLVKRGVGHGREEASDVDGSFEFEGQRTSNGHARLFARAASRHERSSHGSVEQEESDEIPGGDGLMAVIEREEI